MLLKKHFICLVVTLSASLLTEVAIAEEKCKMASYVPPSDSEYTQQYAIDVGDIKGHQIRILEVHNYYEDAVENCEGLKEVERIIWGISDYTNGKGHSWGYQTRIFDNGDKMDARYTGISLRLSIPEGQATGIFNGTYTFTGGTGVYSGVRGTGVERAWFDPETGYLESNNVYEYWIEK